MWNNSTRERKTKGHSLTLMFSFCKTKTSPPPCVLRKWLQKSLAGTNFQSKYDFHVIFYWKQILWVHILFISCFQTTTLCLNVTSLPTFLEYYGISLNLISVGLGFYCFSRCCCCCRCFCVLFFNIHSSKWVEIPMFVLILFTLWHCCMLL